MEINDIKHSKSVGGFNPCKGLIWYKPKNIKELRMLNEHFNYNIPENERFVGSWICYQEKGV